MDGPRIVDERRCLWDSSEVDQGIRRLLVWNGGLRGESRCVTSHGNSGLKSYQIFAHCAPFKHRILEHQVIVDVTAGRRPERPPRREILGLNDSVWNVIQKCWGSDPRIRPTIKYVRDFLGPVSQEWSPPKSEEIESLDLDPSVEASIDGSSLFTGMSSNVKYCDLF